MFEFTLGLALFDFIPVLLFLASSLILSAIMHNTVFLIGMMIMVLAGFLKVIWKLVIATKKKDLEKINKLFVPMQITGFAIVIISMLVTYKDTIIALRMATRNIFPQIIFIILWIVFIGIMIWYKKTKFDKYSLKSNWIAEILNTVMQLCLLIALLCM